MSHWQAPLILLAVVFAVAVRVAPAAEPIPLDKFQDGIRHWKSRQNSDGYKVYEQGQLREIADNLLLYQRANGGWPKNFDPLRVLSEEEQQELAAQRSREDTTFDNRATYPAVEYLALAFHELGDPRYGEAARRGLEFIPAAQNEHGGWPHSYPTTKGYYPQITIVDDVMVGVLTTLRRLAAVQPPLECFDDELLARVRAAHARGDECLVRLQVKVDGKLTAWASQYDRHTLEPTTGRSYELPALISSESVSVLRYLMGINPPTPAVRQAIIAGVEWLERSKIHGLRIERIEAEPVRYEFHTSRDDRIAVEDPPAPPIWARFYEIDTNRPFMANRDGKKVYRLADVERERRTGYSWYGYYAQSLLERDYPAWCKKWNVEPNGGAPSTSAAK